MQRRRRNKKKPKKGNKVHPNDPRCLGNFQANRLSPAPDAIQFTESIFISLEGKVSKPRESLTVRRLLPQEGNNQQLPTYRFAIDATKAMQTEGILWAIGWLLVFTNGEEGQLTLIPVVTTAQCEKKVLPRTPRFGKFMIAPHAVTAQLEGHQE
jgi:hypothetical protein